MVIAKQHLNLVIPILFSKETTELRVRYVYTIVQICACEHRNKLDRATADNLPPCNVISKGEQSKEKTYHPKKCITLIYTDLLHCLTIIVIIII